MRERGKSLQGCGAIGLAQFVAFVLPSIAGSGGLVGRVIDKSGDPVPGAMVVFTCGEGKESLSVQTDENGRFASPRGAEGQCTIEARLAAMDVRTRVERQIATGKIEDLELRLDLDMLSERVAVGGSAVRDSVESREIRESFAYDAGEALARVDGVHKLRKGGIANDVVVRGFKGDNLNVLIDGHRIYGACPNRMDPPAYHVDFAEIERIEVKKGPFDIAHAGSMGGMVNIVTREPDAGFHASVQAAAGSYGYLAPSVTASYGEPRWNLSAGYSQRLSGVYDDGQGTPFTKVEGTNYKPSATDERAFRIESIWAGAAVSLAPSHQLKLQATRQDGSTQLYPYLLMDAEYDTAQRLSATYDAQGPFASVETFEASISWASVDHFMTDALRVSADGMPLPYSMATTAESSVLNAKLELSLSGGITLGVEGYRRNWDTTTRLAGTARDYRAQASIPDVDTNSVGLFAQYEKRLAERLKLHAAARVDQTSTGADPSLANTNLYFAYHGTRATSRSDSYPSASVSATVDVSSAWQLFAGAGQTVRVPDAVERYYALMRRGSDWVGNPDLVPSKNREVDFGARLRSGAYSLDLAAYYSWLPDFVVVVDSARMNPVPGVMNTMARSYVNNDARMWGGEATARWAFGRGWLVSAGLSYVRGVQDLDSLQNINDRDLPEIPPLTTRAALRYDAGKWFVEGEATASAAQEFVDEDLLESRTPGWGVVNVRGGVVFQRFSILAGVANLFDHYYRENLSYQRDPFRSGAQVPEPGASFSVSVLYRY